MGKIKETRGVLTSASLIISGVCLFVNFFVVGLRKGCHDFVIARLNQGSVNIRWIAKKKSELMNIYFQTLLIYYHNYHNHLGNGVQFFYLFPFLSKHF